MGIKKYLFMYNSDEEFVFVLCYVARILRSTPLLNANRGC